ncbi:ATP-NAD kinase, partial [Pseudomonas urmiensis]
AASGLTASGGPVARDQHSPALQVLDLPLTQTVADTLLATRWMVERGASLISVMGGYVTHKSVAAESGDVPLLTLSTGS